MKELAKKLSNVMQECSHIQKNGTNSYHGYRYATSADVLERVNESLVKNGIASAAHPELVSMENVTNARGTTEHLATISMAIELMDTESGDTCTIYGIGSGQDVGDKAVMKAETAAIKYAYLLSLAVSTGDDPEADARTDERMEGSDNRPRPANQSQPAPANVFCQADFPIFVVGIPHRHRGKIPTFSGPCQEAGSTTASCRMRACSIR